MIVAVDAGRMAVGEADGNGVAAYLRGGLRTRLRLKHRQRGKRTASGRRGGERFFLAALVVACGAGTLFPQICEFVVARMAVGPCNVDASARLYMHLYVSGLFSRIKWNR